MNMPFTLKQYFCIASLCLVVAIVRSDDTITEHKVWKFESKPVRSTENDMSEENYIDVEVKKHGTPFRSLTYCLRIAPKDLFSHCVFYEDGIKFIFIDESKYYGFLFFQGIYHIFKLKSKIAIIPEQWYHVCVSYEYIDHMKAHVKMYFDGLLLIDKPLNTHNGTMSFKLSPIWKLGYCKASLLDPTVETTRGKIRDFSVWSRALTDSEMLAYTRDCSIDDHSNKMIPDVIDWNTMKVNRSGSDVNLEYLSFKRKDKLLFSASCKTTTAKPEKIPTHRKGIFSTCTDDFINVQFTKKMQFEEAALTCQQLGGSMPLPITYDDFDDIVPLPGQYQIINSTNVTIEPQETCQTHWLPIQQGRRYPRSEVYQWNKYRFDQKIGDAVRFLPWELGQPNGLEFQQCVVMGTTTRLYYDVDCKESHCFSCSLCKQLHFTLRGLSNRFSKGEDNRNGIDSRYIYIPKATQTDKIHLEGYYDHKISPDSDKGQWEIIRVDTGSVGTLSTDNSYPFGKHAWTLNTSKISDGLEATNAETLKLSLCDPQSQFTCDDGTCVSIDNRCDEISDCFDGSDEDRCKSVLIDYTSYRKQHPPLNVHGNRPLEIEISFDLFMLSEFVEVTFSYKAKFLLTVKWYDHRLRFANLKDSMFKNLIGNPEKEMLWIPPLIFNNSEKNTMVTMDREPGDPVANLLIEKRGNASFAPPVVLDETAFYKGSENLVVYKSEYNLLLTCIYDLGFYPFDTQTCTMEIKSIPSMKDHMKLYAGSVTYHGPKDLLELDVRNVSIQSKGSDHVFVEIKLKRRCLFHLATTYFPSLCLFIISEILLFMNEEHFEATIMVSLTAMLVMYTLHQSILAQLPKTSYMKMIDIWLLYGLTIPFLVFILEVTSQMLRHRKIVRRGQAMEMQSNMQHIIRATIFRPERVHSTQLEQEKLKKAMDDMSKQSDEFTLLETMIIKYKKVTIPLMTTLFIMGYALAALIYYCTEY